LFKRDGTDYSMGLRLEKKHCNYQRSMHGGAVATLADMVMGLVHRRSGEPRVHTVTASMTVDYIGSAKVGEWVEGTAKVLKQGRRLYFSECLITAGQDVGEPRIIARGSASYMPVRGPDGG
jgi:acyl-coenzyme A thioesterase 13